MIHVFLNKVLWGALLHSGIFPKITSYSYISLLYYNLEFFSQDDEPPLSDDDETDSLTSAASTEIALHVLQSRLDHLNVNSLDTIFLDKLREYMGSKVKQDYDDIKGGATTATNLRQLILTSANDLTRYGRQTSVLI